MLQVRIFDACNVCVHQIYGAVAFIFVVRCADNTKKVRTSSARGFFLRLNYGEEYLFVQIVFRVSTAVRSLASHRVYLSIL